MVATHPSRIFASGSASTLYITIPSGVVTDSRFPFEADDEVKVTIEDDRLIVTRATDGTD